MRRPRVFVSYTKADPDERVASSLYRHLSDGCDVFLYETTAPGEEWQVPVDRELNAADFFLVLLSDTSIGKNGVGAEVKMAADLRKRTGRPTVIPVSVNLSEPLPFWLLQCLHNLQFQTWKDEADSVALTEYILTGRTGIVRAEPPQPRAIRHIATVPAGRQGLLRRTTGFNSVHECRVSNDGSRVVTAACEGVARVWDARCGKELFQLDTRSPFVNAVSITPDARTAMVSGSEGSIRVWDLASGQEMMLLARGGSEPPPHSLALTGDGARAVVLGADSTLSVFDIRSARLMYKYREQECVATEAVAGVAPPRLLLICRRALILLDLETGSVIGKMRVAERYGTIYDARPLDGSDTCVLVGGSQRIGLLDVRAGTEVRVLADHGLRAECRLLYSSSRWQLFYNEANHCTVVDLADWSEKLSTWHPDELAKPLQPDASSLVVPNLPLPGESRTLQVFRRPTTAEHRAAPGPQGRHMAVLAADVELPLQNRPWVLETSGDGRCVVAGTRDNKLLFFEVLYDASRR